MSIEATTVANFLQLVHDAGLSAPDEERIAVADTLLEGTGMVIVPKSLLRVLAEVLRVSDIVITSSVTP